ncbi:hypothetical protein AB0878_48400 [Amycolatopsis sp. NPDC047767]
MFSTLSGLGELDSTLTFDALSGFGQGWQRPSSTSTTLAEDALITRPH